MHKTLNINNLAPRVTLSFISRRGLWEARRKAFLSPAEDMGIFDSGTDFKVGTRCKNDLRSI